ncbi:MAG: RNA-binding S4 domain-containing protein [Pseudomonadota bacterium]
MSEDGEALSRRIDKWFWCARRFKTRSLAARFITEASVRVTRGAVTQRIDWPSFQLCEGDVVSYILGERLYALRVTGFALKRGSPTMASSLFADQSKSPPLDAPPPCKAGRSR